MKIGFSYWLKMRRIGGACIRFPRDSRFHRSMTPTICATLNDIDREAVDYFIRKGIEAGRVPDDLHKALPDEQQLKELLSGDEK